jgi:sialate O-acetylesterase
MSCLSNLRRLLFWVAILAGASALHADVRMPGIFGDHMVLQQDMRIPVWGWADPGEKISVALGKDTASTVAGADGKWRVDLPPVSSQAVATTLTVSGKNTVTFSDVLVGDVWLCSGQSNMEFPLRMAHNAATEVPKANDPQLRLFLVPRHSTLHPQDDITGSTLDAYKLFNSFHLNPGDALPGHWVVCTPDRAAEFSAVGYFFVHELRQRLNRPIGLIASYWGGSPAQAWISLSTAQADPALGSIVRDYQKNLAPLAAGPVDMDALYATYAQQMDKWKEAMAHNPGKPAYDAACRAWQVASVQQRAHDIQVPRPPTPPIPSPWQPPQMISSTLLHNGMIAPLIPYAIKGVIWYQGESNGNIAASGIQYRALFAALIKEWRAEWGEGDFPFLFVQLAGNNPRPLAPVEAPHFAWAWLREAQLKTLALPNTGMAVAIDLGSSTTIHPPDKMDVAHRLALVAEKSVYGQDVIDSGPLFNSIKIEGSQIRIGFSNVDGGLIIGTSPWIDPAVPPISTTELQGFAIAGADKKWVWAQAKIEGSDVVVSSDQVPAPVAVRYGWSNNPLCNLYNKANLPASPFRTDNWN